jgi:5-epi-alpha-selinene synthase
MRPFTGGLYTYITLLEVTDQIILPPSVLAHPVVRRLTEMAATIVCWINDLISLGKELRQGDIHNLVLILQHQYELSLQAAIYRAVALHDAQVRAFLDQEMELPAFGPEVDAALARYISSLHCWMRGSLDWSYTSGRYLSATPTEASGSYGTPATILCG